MWDEDAVGVGQGSTVGLCMYWRVPMCRMGVLCGGSGAHIPRGCSTLSHPCSHRVQWAKLGESPRMCLTPTLPCVILGGPLGS